MAKPIKIYSIKVTEYDMQGRQIFSYMEETCYRSQLKAQLAMLTLAYELYEEGCEIACHNPNWRSVNAPSNELHGTPAYEHYGLMVLEQTLK